MAWAQTYTGKKFDYSNPLPASIDIRDIAHALSLVCRFGGHCRDFYSVAQHSVYVSQFVRADLALIGLLHDAAEAYIGDMVSPLKRQIESFNVLEGRVFSAIASKLGIPASLPDEVKAADIALLAAEARDLMEAAPEDWGIPAAKRSIPKIIPWSPVQAEKHFMNRFDLLTGEYARGMVVAAAVPFVWWPGSAQEDA